MSLDPYWVQPGRREQRPAALDCQGKSDRLWLRPSEHRSAPGCCSNSLQRRAEKMNTLWLSGLTLLNSFNLQTNKHIILSVSLKHKHYCIDLLISQTLLSTLTANKQHPLESYTEKVLQVSHPKPSYHHPPPKWVYAMYFTRLKVRANRFKVKIIIKHLLQEAFDTLCMFYHITS